MEIYECGACGYKYDPEKGDPENGIEPGTAFEDLPEDWECPVCGMGKGCIRGGKIMSAVFKLTYGLFVLTAKDGDKDNGCIINTALQVTANPLQVSICVNKDNFTHDMIKKTGEFNISILSQETPFEVFQRFGMQSGKDVDKFDGFDGAARSENGICTI
jgi:rubredoxin